MSKEKLKFYDLVAKKPFYSSDYKFVKKHNRRFAVTTSPSGKESWRAVKAD